MPYLKDLCAELGVAKGGSKGDLVERLAGDMRVTYSLLREDALREILEAKGLPQGGSMADVLGRISVSLLPKKELQAVLKSRGKTTSGPVDELVIRVVHSGGVAAAIGAIAAAAGVDAAGADADAAAAGAAPRAASAVAAAPAAGAGAGPETRTATGASNGADFAAWALKAGSSFEQFEADAGNRLKRLVADAKAGKVVSLPEALAKAHMIYLGDCKSSEGRADDYANFRRLVPSGEMHALILENARSWIEPDAHLGCFFERSPSGAGFVVKKGWEFDVDHAIPQHWGGLDHPRNYIVMPRSLNRSFQAYIDEKMALVGNSVSRRVAIFAQRMKELGRSETEANLAKLDRV
jgi:hypothetical protein